MARNYALCEVQGAKVRHPNRKKLPRYPISAWRFREARLQLGLGVVACAELLRVSDRTIRGWESGATRIPYAAYKLMRVLRGGRYLAHPHWRDFIIHGATLVTPEGHRFDAGDLCWWSLLVRRAKAFGDMMQARGMDRCALPAGALPSGVGVASGAAGAMPASDDSLTTGKPPFPRLRPVKSPGRSIVGPSSNTGQKRPRVCAGGAL